MMTSLHSSGGCQAYDSHRGAEALEQHIDFLPLVSPKSVAEHFRTVYKSLQFTTFKLTIESNWLDMPSVIFL